MKKVLNFIVNYRDVIYIALIAVCCFIISKQHSSVDNLNTELNRQANNKMAMLDTLAVYKDEIGRINAEKHAYQLTQEELRDSIGLLKKKNTDYVSYINTNMNIKDTVNVETVIIRDKSTSIDDGSINICKTDSFGKSSRLFSVSIPYSVNNNTLSTGKGTFTLDQNIFVEGWLERNTKTQETYIHLRSDYPNLTFNSGMGIVAKSSKSYERSMRKNCGIGIGIGPNFSISHDLVNKKLVPTVGIGVTVGFTYTPKWLQW